MSKHRIPVVLITVQKPNSDLNVYSVQLEVKMENYILICDIKYWSGPTCIKVMLCPFFTKEKKGINT